MWWMSGYNSWINFDFVLFLVWLILFLIVFSIEYKKCGVGKESVFDVVRDGLSKSSEIDLIFY